MARKTGNDIKDLKETANKVWLAGLGALASVGEEGGKLFNTLVDKGSGVESRYLLGGISTRLLYVSGVHVSGVASGQPAQQQVEHGRVDRRQELDPRGAALGPADARSERFEVRKARDHRIPGFRRLDQFDVAAAGRKIAERDLEVEAADPAHGEFRFYTRPAEAPSVFAIAVRRPGFRH